MPPVAGTIHRGAWLLTLLALALLVSGCKKKPPPSAVAVKGTALGADGKPLSNVVLLFHPQDKDNQTRVPHAVVKDGRFETTCLPGSYKVTLNVIPAHGHAPASGGALADPGKGDNPQQESIPASYRNANTSPWKVSIPASGKEDFELRVQPLFGP